MCSEVELRSTESSLDAAGFARKVRSTWAELGLIDSMTEPIGRRTDDDRAETPKVVLRRTGVNEERRCTDNTARWEFRVGFDWRAIVTDSGLGLMSVNRTGSL